MARPEDAVYPLNRVSDLEIIYSTGEGEGEWSVARLTYDGIRGRVGVRWNGKPNEPGYPNGRQAKPVWFIVPDELADAVMAETFNLRSARRRSAA
jgi:hypothetical protein